MHSNGWAVVVGGAPLRQLQNQTDCDFLQFGTYRCVPAGLSVVKVLFLFLFFFCIAMLAKAFHKFTFLQP